MAIRLFRQQVSGCTAIDKENIFLNPDRKTAGQAVRLVPLSVFMADILP